MDINAYNNLISRGYAIPVEKMAVRASSLALPTQAIGQSYGKEYATNYDMSTRNLDNSYKLNQQKQDLDIASRQNAIATGITGLGVVASGYNAYKTKQQAAQEARERQTYIKKLDLISDLLREQAMQGVGFFKSAGEAALKAAPAPDVQQPKQITNPYGLGMDYMNMGGANYGY